MALERDFITPAGATVLGTANVVGNTTTTDMFSNTQRATVYPDMMINFAKAEYLDPRVTFSRASAATYIDQFGYIRNANTNVPRFNYANGVCEGLLIEEARTNYFVNAHNPQFIRSVPGTATGPDGTAAQLVIVPAGNATFPSFGGGNLYPFSLAVGESIDLHFTIFVGPSVGPQTQIVDLVFVADVNGTGTNVTYSEWTYNFNANTTVYRYTGTSHTELSATIEPHPSGMNKLTWSVRYTQDGSARNRIQTVVQIRDAAGVGQFVADGVSGIQYACGQFEVGNQPTSYIPTGTSTVTRAADVAYITANNYNFNPKQGTFFVRAKSSKTNTPSQQAANDAATLFNILDSWDQLQNDQLGLQRQNSSYALGAFNFRQGLGYRYSNIPAGSLVVSPNTFVSAAVSYYVSNTFILAANGVLGNSISYHRPIGNQITPNQTILNLGNHYAFTQRSLNGPIAKIAYYSTPLSNSQIQNITL